MNKIKIAFIIDTIDYQMGGTERQLLLLLKNLDKTLFQPYLCVLKTSDWIKDNLSEYKIITDNFDVEFDYWIVQTE